MNTCAKHSPPAGGGPSALPGEFRGKSWLLASAALGLSASMNAVMVYGLGAFIGPLESEFGWRRAEISLAVTIITLGLFLAGPWFGVLCDRFGAARVGALSLAAYGLLLASMAATLDSLAAFWVFHFLIAVAGAGSTPIVLVRPITASFERQRGLALGIALTGAGLVGFWVPNLVTHVVTHADWRSAYFVLAGIALLAAPIVYLGFRQAEGRTATMGGAGPAVGVRLGEARRTSAFRWVSMLAVAMALGVGGVLVHLVPMFRDWGAAPAAAAGIASLIGIASVLGRLAVGLFLDRFPAHLVALIVLGLGIFGLILLGLGGLPMAIPGVVLLGILLGAELDLLAFLTSRLFGQRAFGAIYGWFYSFYVLSFGVGPLVGGQLRDSSGSYRLTIVFTIVMLLAAMVATLPLRTSLQAAARKEFVDG